MKNKIFNICHDCGERVSIEVAVTGLDGFPRCGSCFFPHKLYCMSKCKGMGDCKCCSYCESLDEELEY